MTTSMELYERLESEIEKDEKKSTFYKNTCFLSLGLAAGSIVMFNLANGISQTIAEASILTFIAGSLGALYTKMTKDIYDSSIRGKRNILSSISPTLSLEQIESIKNRRKEMETLKTELALSDLYYKKSKKPKIF